MAQTNSNLSCRQMARLLKKFKINNGDILALRFKSSIASMKSIEEVTDALGKLGINALVVVVESFDDLTVLNETDMAKQGWYRLDSLSKLMKIPKEETKQ